jgi:hypothetical protein
MTLRRLSAATLLLVLLQGRSAFAQPPSDPAPMDLDPVATVQALRMTALRASQPHLFAILADRALGVAIRDALMPPLFGHEVNAPSRSTSGLRRAADAASHTLFTHDGWGRLRFNAAEVGGAGVAAGLSNLYRPATDRSLTATLSRWGTQLLVDTVSNELHEFWPDIRRVFHKP